VTSSDQTIFCSSNNITADTDATNSSWLKFGVKQYVPVSPASGGNLTLSIRKQNDTANFATDDSDNATLGAMEAATWTYVGFSIKIDQASGLKSTIRFFKNDVLDTEHGFANDHELFVDLANNSLVTVGAEILDEAIGNPMTGFVAAFYIDKPYYDSTTVPHNQEAACTSCSSALCTDVTTECLDDWGFGAFGPGASDVCDDTSCT
jgi:hypothetical protein